ncbi:hypothetical protein T492DRAFT_42114 [Pavlovales sp. CCMP2436]|nr:hypothetical protein T492DRAFT_42114 [Pavlovales sp. CCMP2436]
MVRELLGALAVFAGMQVGAAASCKGRACSCTGIEFGRPLKKYEQSVACIYLGDQKAMFYPRVDEYAVLEVSAPPIRSAGLHPCLPASPAVSWPLYPPDGYAWPSLLSELQPGSPALNVVTLASFHSSRGWHVYHLFCILTAK